MLSELPSEEGSQAVDAALLVTVHPAASLSPLLYEESSHPIHKGETDRETGEGDREGSPQAVLCARGSSNSAQARWACSSSGRRRGQWVSTQNTRQFTRARAFTQVHARALVRSVHVASLH